MREPGGLTKWWWTIKRAFRRRKPTDIVFDTRNAWTFTVDKDAPLLFMNLCKERLGLCSRDCEKCDWREMK